MTPGETPLPGAWSFNYGASPKITLVAGFPPVQEASRGEIESKVSIRSTILIIAGSALAMTGCFGDIDWATGGSLQCDDGACPSGLFCSTDGNCYPDSTHECLRPGTTLACGSGGDGPGGSGGNGATAGAAGTAGVGGSGGTAGVAGAAGTAGTGPTTPTLPLTHVRSMSGAAVVETSSYRMFITVGGHEPAGSAETQSYSIQIGVQR